MVEAQESTDEVSNGRREELFSNWYIQEMWAKSVSAQRLRQAELGRIASLSHRLLQEDRRYTAQLTDMRDASPCAS